MMYLVKIIICITLLMLTTVICKKETKKSDNKTPSGPKKRLPDDKLFEDQAAFCEGCYGMIQEISSLLKKWEKKPGSLEDHIDAALVGLCSNERLRAYVLSPPKMTRLCSGILAHYEDEIATAIMKVYSTKTSPTSGELFRSVCLKAIPACIKNQEPMSVVRQKSRDENVESPVMADNVIKGGEKLELSLDQDGNPQTKTTETKENGKAKKTTSTKSDKNKKLKKDEL